MMKVISFNANGIRAAAKKGFYDWLAEQQADVVCIQETKAQFDQLKDNPLFSPSGYVCEYQDAVKKGYSGVALYAKQPPLKITRGLGFSTCDDEGRYLQFDYPSLSLVSIYLPSGTSGDLRQQVKYDFLARLTGHLTSLFQSGREVILCGDINIAHKPIDLKNWKANQKNSGFLPDERAWLDMVFDKIGFVDAFRVLNQQEAEYTWWSNRGQAWAKNVGWRIDYQLVTPALANAITDVSIYRDDRFSDHAPLIIDYEGEWFD